MKKKNTVFTLCAMLVPLCLPAEAQQPTKIPRICYLGGVASGAAYNLNPFRERLRELGYIEGKNTTIEIDIMRAKLIVSQSLPPS